MRRRLLLPILLCLALPLTATAQVVHVQTVCATPGNLFAGGTTYVLNYSALTSGNLVVFAVGTDIRTVSSISGTGVSATINGSSSSNGTAGNVASMWKAISSGTGTSATITISGNSSATAYACMAEFSGADSDQSGSVANGGTVDANTTHGSGSVTPPTANNVVMAAMSRTTGTWTEDGAFTCSVSSDTVFSFCRLIQSAATAQSFDATAVDNEYSAMRIGAFAGTSSASGLQPGGLLLLGAGR